MFDGSSDVLLWNEKLPESFAFVLSVHKILDHVHHFYDFWDCLFLVFRLCFMYVSYTWTINRNIKWTFSSLPADSSLVENKTARNSTTALSNCGNIFKMDVGDTISYSYIVCRSGVMDTEHNRVHSTLTCNAGNPLQHFFRVSWFNKRTVCELPDIQIPANSTDFPTGIH